MKRCGKSSTTSATAAERQPRGASGLWKLTLVLMPKLVTGELPNLNRIYSAFSPSTLSYTDRTMMGVFNFLLSTVTVSASCLPSPVIS